MSEVRPIYGYELERYVDSASELSPQELREQLIGRIILTHEQCANENERDGKAWNRLSPLIYNLRIVSRMLERQPEPEGEPVLYEITKNYTD